MSEGSIPWVEIYTDGSCDTHYRAGAWVAIILIGAEKIVLTGVENNTTHNRMELVAVIEAISYVRNNYASAGYIKIYSDSQYVTELPDRKSKLEAANFLSKKGTLIQNASLVKSLLDHIPVYHLSFVKIKAHQKKTDIKNYNIEADLLARKIVRELVKTSVNANPAEKAQLS